jgi:hypothetical protein
MENVTCNPDAGRTIMGFRDTGYTLNTAIADIVDNSINAQADNVWIEINQDPTGSLQIRIFDDGYGMNKEELIDGMRYGSSEKKEGNALGRFGLGLKTASSSICKKLSVVSRKSKNSKLLLARWDLDLVSARDDWLLQVGEPEEDYIELYREHLSESGTLVCWDNIDRIRDGEDDSFNVSTKVLGQKRRRLREHLSMIFHRFIENDKPNIFLDGEKITPWNPFVPNESTETYIKKTFSVSIPGSRKKHKILLAAHVLPNMYEFSTEEARKKAKLQANLQGFYVYREDRIIIAGDWLQMFAEEQHMALFRAEISFPRELDELYNLDIKKSHMQLVPKLYEEIKKNIEPIRKIANSRYRQGKKEGISKKGSPHKQSQGVLNKTYEENTKNITAEQVAENRVKVQNSEGITVVEMPTVSTSNIKDLIEVVDSIEDGLFWEPAFINGRIGVRINRGHLYYERVYVPNFNDAVTIQGIDSILWALSKCEQEVITKEIQKRLEDIRYFVSRALKEISEELPEIPDIDLHKIL